MTSQQGTESSSLAISSAVEKQQSTLARIAQSPEDSEGTASSAAVASEAPNTLPTSASAAAKASRRRTKTGCLTCRKRRIKCGEERPICANCVKSKRTCEGYNQRVVFKDGMNSFRAVPGAPSSNQVPVDRRYHPYPIQPAPPSQPLQPIAPAPPPLPSSQLYSDQSQHAHLRRFSIDQQLPHSISQADGRRQSQEQPKTSHHPQSSYYKCSDMYTGTSSTSSHIHPQLPSSIYGTPASHQQTGFQASQLNACYPSHISTPANSCPFNPPIDSKYIISAGSSAPRQHTEGFDGLHDIPTFAVSAGAVYFPIPVGEVPAISAGISFPSGEWEPGDDDSDEDLDDAFDDRDEEPLDYSDDEAQAGITPRAAISNLLASNSEPMKGVSFRSFLPDSQTLSTYYPSQSSSPLMDPTTARIFCHFVYVLGPSISIFERHAPNPAMTFAPGSQAPKNVWAYTIPMLALGHPPLLHAVLALSSLHIAKLTKGPSHASLLHYHIALRRLGKSIASEKKRSHVATLAATLILAYYETMAAEHEKWASHILGAKQLLQEIDFDYLSRGVESLDDERKLREQYPDPTMRRMMIRNARKQRETYGLNEEDENLTSFIMGKKGVRRDYRAGKKRSRKTTYSKKELETCQLQSDLFWWFVKMDLYQSLLSGNKLTLDYVHWGQCPPRAKIGTLGTTYGSSDHLFLLMGRLADFQYRDLNRKKAVEKMNGRWIPPPEYGGPPRGMMGMGRGRGRGGPRPPGFSPGGPPMGASGALMDMGMGTGMGMNMGRGGPPSGMMFPGGGPPPHMMGNPMGGPPTPLPTPPPNGPIMYGMVPSTPSRAPRAFTEHMGHNNRSGITIHQDDQLPEDPAALEAATVEAEVEWNEIFEAFQVFQENLGKEYKPMPIEYMPVQSTPFGPAIYYRTYSIATLQSLYYTALMILHRVHPTMPAQVMMAAGIAAPKTTVYAVDIARITAGLVPTDPTAQINPSLGASLIEASIPLFFAGVQYRDQSHRDWLVHKLREITRLSGWASASRILLGCQRAWERMASMGHGPPYKRPPPEDEAEVPLPGMPGHPDTLYPEDTVRLAGGVDNPRMNFIVTSKSRVEFAMGLLGEPDELMYPIAVMNLDDEEE